MPLDFIHWNTGTIDLEWGWINEIFIPGWTITLPCSIYLKLNFFLNQRKLTSSYKNQENPSLSYAQSLMEFAVIVPFSTAHFTMRVIYRSGFLIIMVSPFHCSFLSTILWQFSQESSQSKQNFYMCSVPTLYVYVCLQVCRVYPPKQKRSNTFVDSRQNCVFSRITFFGVISIHRWVKNRQTQLLGYNINITFAGMFQPIVCSTMNSWICPFLTQRCMEITQHFLGQNLLNIHYVFVS